MNQQTDIRTDKKKRMQNLRGQLLLLLTAVIWGFAFIAQKYGAGSVGAFSFNGIRYLLGAVSLIPVILIFERKTLNREVLRRTVPPAVLSGIVMCIATMLQQYGIMMTDSAGTSGFLTGLYNLFVPILAFVLFRKKTGLPLWIGAIFALGGLFFLCNPTSGAGENATNFPLGAVLVIAGAVFWAMQILIIDRVVNEVRPVTFAMVQFVSCGVICMLGALFLEREQLFSVSALSSALIPILYCGLMSVGVAYTCQILGQKNADPTLAAIVLSTESLFSAVGGALFGSEKMNAGGLVGCALIFVGILVAQIRLPAKQK